MGSMHYISTRGGGEPLGFQQAVMTGLARDGGLLLPAVIPDVRDKLAAWRGLSYTDLAFEVMRLFTDIPEEDLRAIITDSYSSFRHPDVAPVVKVGNLHVLELFHGPTLAFKDIALQFLGSLFEYILARSGGELNIVAATSGDTGSAAIYGVRGREHIRIFVLFPKGRVSPAQERQMTSVLDDNVFCLAVEGTFDDCQGIVKSLFNDLDFRDTHALGAVNSINWARILAQIVYYFYAAFRVQETTGADRVRFTVPTGNFGDIFAGYMAARMGLPIGKLVVAANANDILSRFFYSGIYESGDVHITPSPSMDIQVASNFERYLFYRAGGDPAAVRAWMGDFSKTGRLAVDDWQSRPEPLFDAYSAGTPETLAAIRQTWADHAYLADPHTAVGLACAERALNPDEPMICLATAHPAKFSQAIQDATGQDLAKHPELDALSGLPVRCTTVANSEESVREFISDLIEKP
ncbi:MAG: threonine synthase [Kiritimatiellia bacterium]